MPGKGPTEEYKRLNEWGEYSWTGSFFADYECNFNSREELSKNTVIYWAQRPL